MFLNNITLQYFFSEEVYSYFSFLRDVFSDEFIFFPGISLKVKTTFIQKYW